MDTDRSGPHYLRLIWRAQLHGDSILTAQEAGDALLDGPSGLRWVEKNVTPIAEIDTSALYRWSDVIEALTGKKRAAPPTEEAEETWLTVAEAAEQIRVSERLIRRLLAEGRLDHAVVRAGRTWRINKKRLVEALSSGVDDGVATRTEPKESADGGRRDVLLDRVERPREDEDHGPRLRRSGRGQSIADEIRGQARRWSGASSAEENRRWLENE